MIHKLNLLLIPLLLFMESFLVYLQSLPIDYLGQKAPGYFPEIFAGEITNGVTEYCHSFSPDGKEFYFAVYESGGYTIKYMEKIKGVWSGKMRASFCSSVAGDQDASPCFSPDGNKMFFISNRKGGLGDWDIWYVERTDSGWSIPINPGSPINSANYEDYPFLGKDSVFYFNSDRARGSGSLDMYRATYHNGKFENVSNLGDSINSSTYDENPVVIGDKLIFGNRDKRTLNICYKTGENRWSRPEVISGGTYTDAVYYGFRCSPDDKYFFFGRSVGAGTGREYWVDIEALNYLGVKEVPFNYITSWYAGDTNQMKQALHVKLVKRRVVTTKEVWNVSYDWMIHAVKSGTGRIENIKQAQKEIQILDQTDTIASAKVISNRFIDYLQLAKINNQWKIVNALWEYKATPTRGTVEEAKHIAIEYIKSWKTGNSKVMKDILLPDFAGRMALSLTEVENVDYHWMVNEMKNCIKCNAIKDAIVNDYKILDTSNNIASVKIIFDNYVEYLHLSYIDNQWYIVNSLRNFALNP